MKNVSENRENVNTGKGVKTSIESEKYENVLFNKKLIKMKIIQSKLHKIGTYDVCKIFLSCFDDNDGMTTLAYFHKDLKDSNLVDNLHI